MIHIVQRSFVPPLYKSDGTPSNLVLGKTDRPVPPVSKSPVPAPVIPVAIPSLVGANDEKEMLLKIAAEKGIKIDGRWRLPKLRKAVEAASL
jgi:hypothetical protein